MDPVFDNQGIEIKRFHIRDGLGIKLWMQCGLQFGVLTSRNSNIVKIRAAELNIRIVPGGAGTTWIHNELKVGDRLIVKPGEMFAADGDVASIAFRPLIDIPVSLIATFFIMYLAGFRNRVSVLVEWAYRYFTYERGARLITGRSSTCV